MKNMKRAGKALLMMLILFCGILALPQKKAEAAYYSAYVNDLKQTSWGQTNAGISWTARESSVSDIPTAGFRIYVGTGSSDKKLVGTVGAQVRSFNLTGLADGKEYYVSVEPYAQSGQTGSYDSEYIETIPASVKNFKQKQWWYFIKTLDVGWDRIETADKIEVTLYNSKGKKVKTETVSGYSSGVSFYKMKDEVYTVTARACKTVNGQTYWTPVSKIQCFNQARIKSIKAKKKKLTIKWGKVGGATGYDVYVSTKPKSGYKKVKSVGKSKSSLTISKFRGKAISPKKRYYVYVETKKKSGGKTNKSGALYYWDSKSGGYGYLN